MTSPGVGRSRATRRDTTRALRPSRRAVISPVAPNSLFSQAPSFRPRPLPFCSRRLLSGRALYAFVRGAFFPAAPAFLLSTKFSFRPRSLRFCSRRFLSGRALYPFVRGAFFPAAPFALLFAASSFWPRPLRFCWRRLLSGRAFSPNRAGVFFGRPPKCNNGAQLGMICLTLAPKWRSLASAYRCLAALSQFTRFHQASTYFGRALR